jgi:protein-disulfide isomerase
VPRNQLRTESRSRSPVVGILIAVAVVGMGAVAYSVSSDVGGNDMAIAPIEMPVLDNTDRLVELAQPIVRGNPDANIRIIEFGDYQCPSCRFFQQEIKPSLDSTYVQPGEAQFVFYDFPLDMHPHAFLAARAARCAGDQQKYWEYHDALYTNQPTWSMSAGPARLFIDYAAGLGADEDAFEACLRSDRFADVVTANLRFATELSLPGTPSVMVQGRGLPKRVDWTTLETLFPAIITAIDSLKASGDTLRGSTDSLPAGRGG